MEQLNLWRERIKDRESSGLTVKDWCSKNGINPATYASWKTKVKKADSIFIEVDNVTKQPAEVKGDLLIKWHGFEFHLSCDAEIKLMSELMKRLVNQQNA